MGKKKKLFAEMFEAYLSKKEMGKKEPLEDAYQTISDLTGFTKKEVESKMYRLNPVSNKELAKYLWVLRSIFAKAIMNHPEDSFSKEQILLLFNTTVLGIYNENKRPDLMECLFGFNKAYDDKISKNESKSENTQLSEKSALGSKSTRTSSSRGKA